MPSLVAVRGAAGDRGGEEWGGQCPPETPALPVPPPYGELPVSGCTMLHVWPNLQKAG